MKLTLLCPMEGGNISLGDRGQLHESDSPESAL